MAPDETAPHSACIAPRRSSGKIAFLGRLCYDGGYFLDVL
jgi:hypothetical protein